LKKSDDEEMKNEGAGERLIEADELSSPKSNLS